MDKLDQFFEQFKVHANELRDKVRELIKEGNVRRIIIKDEQGHTFMEIPLTVATVGVVLAPILAAVGAIATLVAQFHIVVERTTPSHTPPGAADFGDHRSPRRRHRGGGQHGRHRSPARRQQRHEHR